MMINGDTAKRLCTCKRTHSVRLHIFLLALNIECNARQCKFDSQLIAKCFQNGTKEGGHFHYHWNHQWSIMSMEKHWRCTNNDTCHWHVWMFADEEAACRCDALWNPFPSSSQSPWPSIYLYMGWMNPSQLAITEATSDRIWTQWM